MAGSGPNPQALRRAIAAGGLLVLLALGALLYARGVDPVEVAGALLFIPVFLGVLLGRVVGGLIAAAVAALAYVVLRYPAIEAVGAGQFTGLIVARTLAYLAFGGIGGWAMGLLRGSLDKLDLYDHVDDATGLYNARYLVDTVELEVARSTRYKTIFSIVVVDVPAGSLNVGGRARTKLFKELGRAVTDLVRTVDGAVHARSRDHHRLAVVLSETAADGARVFADRYRDFVVAFLRERGVQTKEGAVKAKSFTHPGDEKKLEGLRREFAALVDTPAPT